MVAIRLQEGDAAPDFSLPDQDGHTLTLKSFAGSPLVVYFYPKDDTSGCTAEAIAFNGKAKDFSKAQTAMLGVSPDPVKSHEKFRAKHGLEIPLASDETKAACESYGVWVEKSMYGRKYMGVERTTFLVDGSGKIAKVWHKVKVPGHVDEVLAAAKAM